MAKRFTRKKVANGPANAPTAEKNAAASSPPSWLKRDWLPGLILALAVILTYTPVWQAGFIWDDNMHVTRPELRSWEGMERIWFILGAAPQYYPVVHSIFWIEHRLWNDAPLGYHLVNVFLYVFSVLLLLKILRRLEVPGAWLAAALWALHPVQVESVAWVSEIKNMLSGVFYFSSALFYLKFDGARQLKAYAFSLILFILGLLSKSVIATLPAALLLVFWWRRGKLSWRQDVAPLLPFFAVAAGSGLLTVWVERRFIGAVGDDYHFTPMERGLIAGRAIWFYLGKLAWPVDLIFIYPHWDISQAVWWQYLFPAAAMILVAGLIWLSRRRRGPLAGFLFFAGTLFPALGFFNVYPFRYSFVADHFQYLACLGIIVPCAAGLTRFSDFALATKPRLRSGLMAGLLVILGVLSWQRTWAYESEEKLWMDTLARNPNCWMAYNNLGFVLFQKGQIDEGMVDFRKAFEINPKDAEAYYNLGFALLQKRRIDEAIAEFKKSLEINPHSDAAHNDLDGAFFQKGEIDAAIAEFQEALRVNPNNRSAQDNLAKAEAMLRQETGKKED
ncbi:MAG TPA: tetratricopeptide repeat protein [Candidatus Methylacidiphilales bacterium]|nr:tetratricopeptide repeat protein [Candidatus Methylacidiphilales bacterium]